MSSHQGVFRALVKDVSDPEAVHRVRVMVPALLGQQLTEWAWPSSAATVAPALDTVVWVMFEGGDINYPIYFSQVPIATMPAGGASDLGSVIALANGIRAALISAGLAR